MNRTHSTTRTLTLALMVGFLAVTGLGGCATEYTDFSAFVKDPTPLVTSTEYRLAPPDVIMINSKVVREISGHTEMIRTDGRIMLPLVGPVFVAGKTCEQVSKELEDLYRAYYKDADVTLRVTGYNSKKIYVFGEVSTPGAYQYSGANTVLGTLAVAQPTRMADKDRIQILRPNRKGELAKRMTVNMNKMIKEGDTGLDAVLEEGDVIFVPPTALAAAGFALQQLLLPIQPAANVMKGPADISATLSGQPYAQPPHSIQP